jgi:hypothetical protein
MDPATLIAVYKAATTAIDLAKKGVALYKEIKSTGGDIKDVLADLKSQFQKLGPSPSQAQVKQYNEEVKRVQEIAKADPRDVLNDIWDHLGTFVDQYDLLSKAYVQSESSAKQVYKGDMSLGRRALERLRIRHQLDAMLAEVREQMCIYAPKELGSLWEKFEKMWMQIVAEQDAALAEEMRQIQAAQRQRRKAIETLKAKMVWIGAVFLVILWYVSLMVSLRLTQTYRGSFSSPWWSCVLC